MRKAVVVTLVGLAMLVPLVAMAQDDGDVTISDVAKYLDKMDLKYELNEDEGRAYFPISGDNGNFAVLIIADTDVDVVYIGVVDYLKVPEDHPNCDKVLRRLMELNWDLTISKFEWDSSDGEIRISYALCTDNGLGFDAFASALVTVVSSADKYYPELKELVEGE